MIDFQDRAAEQLQQFSRFQKDTLDSLQARSAAAVDSYEKLSRYNLEVLTDVINFGVEQARVATTTSDAAELVSRQIDNASAFAKVVEGRSKEFVDLMTETATTVSKDFEAATKATKSKVVKAVAKKSA